MKKTFKILLLTISTLSVFLSACTVNLEKNRTVEDAAYEDRYDVIDKGPVRGGAVRLFTTPVDTLNPVTTGNLYVQDFLGLVFEGLYTLDYEQQPLPVLAKGTSVSTDGLTVTVELKENIKWHDKTPFKAEDVVFTINTLLDAKTDSVYKKNVQNIAAVTASGNKVIINMKQPYSFIKNQLTFPIISSHIFANSKLEDKKSKANLTPVGTGPYCFEAFDEKNGVKLKLNEEWWNAESQPDERQTSANTADTANNAGSSSSAQKDNSLRLPYLATIEIKVFNNSSSAYSAFQARDVDVLPAQYNEYRKYIGRTDINLKRYTGRNFEFLTLNIKKGPLMDKRLRNALNYMLDKKLLVDNAATGIAVPAEIPLTPNSWVYKLVNLEEKDSVGKAKELMAQSGYSLDAKKKYVKKGSKKAIALKLIVNDGNALRFNTATELAAQLGKSGITVQVVKLPWESYKNALKSGAYDLALTGYKVSSVPDLSFAYSTAEIQSGLNVAGYSNPAVDGYLQQILTNSNAETQKSLFINLINTVVDERPYIGLYFINDSMMYGKNIRGAVNPYVWNKYNDITRWYLP